MPPAPDPLTNPYAPPAVPEAPSSDTLEPRTSRRPRYQDEVRSVVLLVLLSCVTLGVYPSIWYVRRARFLDALDADKKVGALPWLVLVFIGALFVMAVARGPEPIMSALQLAGGIASLLLAFRVAAILRSDFARSGRIIHISGAGVFFFGCLYLQHVINEAADTPARRSKKRQRAE